MVGRSTDQFDGPDLRDLLLLIAEQPDGLDVALDILSMRLFSDRTANKQHEPELLEVGQELLQRFRFRTGYKPDAHRLARVVQACLTGKDAAPIAAGIARELRRAIAAHEIHSSVNRNLLKALLTVQAQVVLDALFEGSEDERRAGVKAFDRRSSASDEISCSELIAWCNQDGEARFPLAASFITFAYRPEINGPQIWSDQAMVLLLNAPDFRSVLAEFVRRFRPMSWSGSRAALMEANVPLLEILEAEVPEEFLPTIAAAKNQLEQDVAIERQYETERDRARDERFE